MGNPKWTEDYFRKRVRDERTARNLTQAELAELLTEKDIAGMHVTTVAKIEAGNRSVRIDEAAALAEIFETTVDALLGRAIHSEADRIATEVRLTRYTAMKVLPDIQMIQERLRSSSLALFFAAGPDGHYGQYEGDALTLMEGCTDAAKALAEADKLLTAALGGSE